MTTLTTLLALVLLLLILVVALAVFQTLRETLDKLTEHVATSDIDRGHIEKAIYATHTTDRETARELADRQHDQLAGIASAASGMLSAGADHLSRIGTNAVSDLANLRATVERIAETEADTGAPRGQRVVVTDVDGDSVEGFLASEDRHRVVLEDATVYANGESAKAVGRQHIRQRRIKRTQEIGD